MASVDGSYPPSLATYLLSQRMMDEADLQMAEHLTKVVIKPSLENIRDLPANFFSQIATLFPKVRDLEISNYGQFSVFRITDDDFLEGIAKLTPRLTAIHLESCTSLTRRSFDALLQSCQNLEKVDITSDHLTNDHVQAALRIRSLTSLIFTGANAINDDALKLLSEQGGHLQHLGVSIFANEGRPSFSLKAANAFALTLPQLQSLYFNAGQKVDAEFIENLVQNHPCLSVLAIHPDPEVTEEVAEKLAKCPLEMVAFGDKIVEIPNT